MAWRSKRAMVKSDKRRRQTATASEQMLGLGVLAARIGFGRAGRCGEKTFLHRFPQIQIAIGHVVEHRPWRLAENIVELAAEFRLLVKKDLQALFQITAHETLH